MKAATAESQGKVSEAGKNCHLLKNQTKIERKKRKRGWSFHSCIGLKRKGKSSEMSEKIISERDTGNSRRMNCSTDTRTKERPGPKGPRD